MLIYYIYILILFFIYFENLNSDSDIRRILQYLEGYLTLGYLRTPNSDKDNKIMDLLDKDPNPNPNILKYSIYPICPGLIVLTNSSKS